MPSRRWLIAIATTILVTTVAWWLLPSTILREKAATYLVMPTGFIWFLAAFFGTVGWCLQNRMTAITGWLLWALLGFAGNGYVSRALIGSLEQPFVTIEPLTEQPFSTIIVLGGGSSEAANRMAQLEFAGDRVALAARMYHAGLVEKIICTGARIQGLQMSERLQGELAQEILEDFGVPHASVIPLGGRNTTEEMREIAARVQNESRIGLITSAWHLARAIRLAKRAGLDVIPLPAGFLSRPTNRLQPIDCIPTGNSLLVSEFAVKEYLAGLLGR